MSLGSQSYSPHLDTVKFRDPETTAKGEERALVTLTRLKTLWFNTGSLCNISCVNCYMDSSPQNDSLLYLSAGEVRAYLDEIEGNAFMPVEEIAFTGGEPFMNAELPEMIEEALARGYKALVLTNAMKPMWNVREKLAGLVTRYREKLNIRVSIDHYTREKHEAVRGDKTWEPMLRGLKWLVENHFKITVAGRRLWEEPEDQAREGYEKMFRARGVPVSAATPAELVLFPEMDAGLDVPEITVSCWEILGVAPETMMCATSRMVIKRKESDEPVIVPCTLLPYEPQFELGSDLEGASKSVRLNHPHCAAFCVLGGGSCTVG
jgi:organic radical activating enzyme